MVQLPSRHILNTECQIKKPHRSMLLLSAEFSTVQYTIIRTSGEQVGPPSDRFSAGQVDFYLVSTVEGADLNALVLVGLLLERARLLPDRHLRLLQLRLVLVQVQLQVGGRLRALHRLPLVALSCLLPTAATTRHAGADGVLTGR